jgi:hypothetical protein
MSCDVKPGGLSTSRTPSGARLSVGLRATLLDLREERFDTRGAGDALVVSEQNLRRRSKAKGLPQARSQVTGKAIESFERRRPIGVRAQYADVDLGGAKIAGDLDGRHCDKPDDARIFRAIREKACDLFANRFSKPVGTTILSHKDVSTPRTQMSARGRDQVVAAPRVRANSSVR